MGIGKKCTSLIPNVSSPITLKILHLVTLEFSIKYNFYLQLHSLFSEHFIKIFQANCEKLNCYVLFAIYYIKNQIRQFVMTC